MRLLAITLLPLIALGAQAATYKWVDEKGQTHYSNTPPPSGATATAVKTVEDRISVYASEPLMRKGRALERRQRLAEQEWLQRQQLMARNAYYTQATYRPPPPVYRQSSYYPASAVIYRTAQIRTVRTRTFR